MARLFQLSRQRAIGRTESPSDLTSAICFLPSLAEMSEVRLRFDPITGKIAVANNSALDFETNPVFNLIVEVTDSSGVTDTATVTLSVNPLNDNNPVTDTESFTVLEGATATETDLDIWNFAIGWRHRS